MPTHDLIIRGATLFDGTGREPVLADVAVDGPTVVAVGELGSAAALREIDASGLAVAPGFIDVHTHDDGALLSAAGMVPKVSQGVTTVIAGHCGISLPPLVLDRTPPAPLTLVGGRENFRFGSFADYIRALEAEPPPVNAALLTGHTTLRFREMAAVDRAASDREIARMEGHVRDAMEGGAFGLSTGLDYAPALASSTEEVVALASEAARLGGHYVTHTRNYFERMDEAIEEAIAIASRAGGKLVISHHQCTGEPNFGKAAATLRRLDAAAERLPLALDCYPYAASSTVLKPERCGIGVPILITWSDPYPDAANRRLAEIAREWGCQERDAAIRLLPAGAVYFQLDEDDVRTILSYPRTMIGSDGLPHDRHPHPRLWGTFPRVLGHYSRDLGLFPPAEAVFRMTGLPAREFGLERRGTVAPGSFADLVLFDPATVGDRATYLEPTRPARGIHGVFVNGEQVWREGVPTGARPGRVLRPPLRGPVRPHRFGGCGCAGAAA